MLIARRLAGDEPGRQGGVGNATPWLVAVRLRAHLRAESTRFGTSYAAATEVAFDMVA